MQTLATFHVMPDESDDNAHFYYACLQAAHFYRQQQRVYIFTPDQTIAHQIDELLWSFEADSFVPHNLVGEGPRQGSPVEIGWQPLKGRRPILINLASTVPNFAGQFAQVIDFVPANEENKQLARDRFRTCRQWGFQVETHQVNTQNLTELTQA